MVGLVSSADSNAAGTPGSQALRAGFLEGGLSSLQCKN